MSKKIGLAIGGVPIIYIAIWAILDSQSGAVPAIIIPGVPAAISLGVVMKPLAGIILGPVGGALGSAIGAWISNLMYPYTAIFGPMSFWSGMWGSLMVGLWVIGRRAYSAACYFLWAVLHYVLSYGTAAYEYPAYLYGLQPVIFGLLILSPVGKWAVETLRSWDPKRMLPAACLMGIFGTYGDEAAGSWLFLQMYVKGTVEVWNSYWFGISPWMRIISGILAGVIATIVLPALRSIGLRIGPDLAEGA